MTTNKSNIKLPVNQQIKQLFIINDNHYKLMICTTWEITLLCFANINHRHQQYQRVKLPKLQQCASDPLWPLICTHFPWHCGNTGSPGLSECPPINNRNVPSDINISVMVANKYGIKISPWKCQVPKLYDLKPPRVWGKIVPLEIPNWLGSQNNSSVNLPAELQSQQSQCRGVGK